MGIINSGHELCIFSQEQRLKPVGLSVETVITEVDARCVPHLMLPLSRK